MKAAVVKDIRWSDAFRIGIREIDDQHEALFTQRNKLAACCGADNAVHSEGFHEVLGELFAYARNHFSSEENYMELIGFPDQESHIAEHTRFIEDISELSISVMDNRATPKQVLDFLTGWLISHILQTDQKIGGFETSRQDFPDAVRIA